MIAKTYAIHGLSEWHGSIKAGAISVNVSFTGGTASPSGAVPAYFMTKDPITQFVIENSKEFKNGFIRIEMQQAIAGEHPRMATHKPTPEATETATPVATPVVENGDEMHGEVDGGTPAVEGDDSEPATPASDGTGPTIVEEGGVQKVTVADKPEAIEWLKEHFPDKGYTSTKLSRKAAFEEACKECNVEFIFN